MQQPIIQKLIHNTILRRRRIRILLRIQLLLVLLRQLLPIIKPFAAPGYPGGVGGRAELVWLFEDDGLVAGGGTAEESGDDGSGSKEE